MADRILIVTHDPSTQKELAEVLQQEHIEIVTTAPGLDVLRRVRDLEPRLILLDISLADVSGYDVCRKIKDSEFASTPVILLFPSNEPSALDRRRERLSGADTTLGLPFPATARHTLLRYYFQAQEAKGRGFMTNETRVVLDLMTHRTAAILYSELAQICAPEQGTGLRDGETDEDILRRIPACLDDLLKDPAFGLRLAARLLNELPGLIWIEVAERLTEGDSCQFNGLGSFQRGFIPGQLKVSFTADRVLIDRKLPYMDYAAQSDTLAAMNASREVLTPILIHLAQSDSKPEELLGRALPDILGWFNKQPEVAALDVAAAHGSSQHGRRRDWLSFRARAITHAVFYTYLVERARTLHSDKRFDVETIGTFTLQKVESKGVEGLSEQVRVLFLASPHFISLLEANPLARSAHQ